MDVDAVNIFEELEDFLDYMDRQNGLQYLEVRIPKRYLRDNCNCFEFFYEDSFQLRFRFSKNQVMFYLLPIVEEDLQRRNNRGLPVHPVIQLLVALRFYASGSYQNVLGDLVEIAQSTVCLCIQRVSESLAYKLNEYLHFAGSVEDQTKNISLFNDIASFPHVAACIDGTLIKIASPGKAIAEIFRCRKGYFAMNILAAVGPRGEFLFMDVRHPGSTHDQTCFDRSALKVYFEGSVIRGLLLGDNGYSCQKYLLTPVLRLSDDMQRSYNRSHIRTRNTVERTFGRWKRKFTCLSRGLKNHIDNSIAIICATAVLWNLHLQLNYPIENERIRAGVFNDVLHNIDNGILFRREFIERYFQ